MAVIGTWGSFTFEVTANVARGFTELKMTSGSKTEDKTSSSQQYVSRKSALANEVTISVQLNAYLGCSVRDETVNFMTAAANGTCDYFYIAGKKLFDCQLMLTKADVSDVSMTPKGEWTQSTVQLTFKQCGKNGNVSSSSSSSGSSSSSSSGSTTGNKTSVTQTSYVQDKVIASTTTSTTTTSSSTDAKTSKWQEKIYGASSVAKTASSVLSTALSALKSGSLTSSKSKLSTKIKGLATKTTK